MQGKVPSDGDDRDDPRAFEDAIVMGILNVTPDSFSDGGLHDTVDQAVRRALEMVDQGAHIVDVGGESTRPGAEPVAPAVEQRRIIPVIEALSSSLDLDRVRISVDTRHPSTALAAVAAGASLINDVSASLWETAAETGVGWVAMHMAGDPTTMQRDPTYDDVAGEVRRFLVGRAEQARRAGVEEIWVDPGIGFGKTTAQNLELLAKLKPLCEEGFPVLVGTSRKRFLGELTARSDDSRHLGGPKVLPTAVDDRLEGSLVSAIWAIIDGARGIRVHDVGATATALETARRHSDWLTHHPH